MPYLVLTVRVTNLAGQPLEFQGWHSAGITVTLRDSLKNYYNFMKYKPHELPGGTVGCVTIQPGETIKDVLVFECPPSVSPNSGLMAGAVSTFELDLPLKLRKYEFVIPGSLVRKLATALSPMGLVRARPAPAAAAPASPAPQARPLPRKEPTLADLLREDYERLWTQAVHKSKTKNRDTAREFLRLRKQEILTELADTYKLPRSEVSKILP